MEFCAIDLGELLDDILKIWKFDGLKRWNFDGDKRNLEEKGGNFERNEKGGRSEKTFNFAGSKLRKFFSRQSYKVCKTDGEDCERGGVCAADTS